MTPEERAVINAAIQWRRAIPGRRTALTVDLEALIWQLIVRCAACNYERHICPGCGANIGHGETACAACSDGPREDRLSGELIPAGQDAELERQGREIAGEIYLFGSDAHGGPMSGEGPVNVINGCNWPRMQCVGHQPPAAECNNCAPVLAGASVDRVDGSDLTEPCVDCGEVRTVWHPRPLRDVRKGDVIRPAGTDAQSTVTDRYWPPQPATRNPDGSDGLPKDRGVWHVVPGEQHWDDHVVQPGEVVICLDGGEPRNMAPDFAVEILLDPAEIAAIDAIGWDNRLTSE